MATGDDAAPQLQSDQQSEAANAGNIVVPQGAEGPRIEAVQMTIAAEKVDAESPAQPCSLCDRPSTADTGEQILECSGCQMHAHRSCYGSSESNDHDVGNVKWRCDLCAAGVDRAEIKCEYCCQREGGLPMKFVAARQQQRQEGDSTDTVMTESRVAYGHFLCIEWDPEVLAAEEIRGPKSTQQINQTQHQAIAETQAHTTPPTVPSQDGIGDEPNRPCCFCQSSTGIRIQCRQVNCCRFFHAMCCSQQSNGRLEHASYSSPLDPQRVAYCDRHHTENASIADLLEKLTSKQMSSLVGQKIVKQFQLMQRKMKQHSSPDSLLTEIVAILVDVCRQGLQASTSDPQVYETKHLQALQFVLNYFPQLQRVYPNIDSKLAHEWVDDPSLQQQLVAMFDPARYVSKYAGPATQQHACHVCHEPFQQRQHVFYCVHESTPHAQHWKCTKRKSTSREREKQMSSGSAKKKLKSITMVQKGVWHDVQLPKGLPSVSDDVICSICRCAIDASGLIASRGEAKSIAFAKKESVFAHNGCFVNTLSGGNNSRHAASASAKAAAAKAGSTATGAKQADNRIIRRTNSTSSVEPPKASQSSGIAAPDVSAAPILAPPKMERINVQRTLRWLACIAQIIRIVRAHAANPSKEKPAEEDAATESMDIETADNTADVAETAEPPPVPTPSLMEEVDVYFEEAKTVVGSYDAYVLDKLQTAREMLRNRSGPALAVLNLVAQEYTRFMHIKHTRAVEKAAAEKRKREEEEAQELREQERKRLEREAELALKAQMLAMRKQQRKQQQAKQSVPLVNK